MRILRLRKMKKLKNKMGPYSNRIIVKQINTLFPLIYILFSPKFLLNFIINKKITIYNKL